MGISTAAVCMAGKSRNDLRYVLTLIIATACLGLGVPFEVCGQTPSLGGRVKLTFDDVPAGTVLSRCVGGGILPTCAGGTVANLYPGITFYSGSAILSGPLNNNQVVIVKLPPVPASFQNTANPPAVPIPSSTNVVCAQSATGGADCRGRVFIKFQNGVTKLAYTVAAGYDFRPSTFFSDDISTVVTYGPSGFQIQQTLSRMFFVWNRFVNLSTFPLTNITGFELFTTNSHQATWGMGGPAPAGLGGGIGLDSIEFLAGPGGLCTDTNLDGNVDDDEDFLCDNWEVFGIDVNQDGVIDLALPGADPRHKDVFYELDHMGDSAHTHSPNQQALALVVDAFNKSPASSVKNPDGLPGINLHLEVDVSETLPEQALVELQTARAVTSPTFQDLKQGLDTIACDGHFGTVSQRAGSNCEWVLKAKFMSHRYGMFAHTLAIQGLPQKSYGEAEIGGNDFVVTMGDRQGTALGWNAFWQAVASLFGTTPQAESTDTIAAVVMHEIGHNLFLQHGGADSFNCKPNYLSIMSYSRAYNGAGYDGNGVRRRIDRVLDFSRSAVTQLNEFDLDENTGVDAPTGTYFLFGRPTLFPFSLRSFIAETGKPVDWDGINGITTGAQEDISFFKTGGCDNPQWNGSIYQGQDDWAVLSYSIQDKGAYDAAGPAVYSDEQTDDDYLNISFGNLDEDGDTVENPVDNCPLVSNPSQGDTNGNGIGDACEGTPPVNAAPVANAGTDQSVTFPNHASLNGSAADDGLPSNTLAFTWTAQSGPGTVTFADSTKAVTTASFSAPGTYVLRLTADDGALTGSDDVEIAVNVGNSAPTANAGTDQTVEATSPQGAQVTLSGLGSADPDNDTLTYEWSGPFGKLNTAMITPTLPLGSTTLTLTVDDGRGGTASDTVNVTVRDTTPPSVTPPASITITATEAGGARGSASPTLATFLLAGAAVDLVDPGPVRLVAEVSGVPASNSTLFPIGQTSVTFRFRDSAQNVGTASASVTVSAGPQPPTCAVDVTSGVSLGTNAAFKLNRGTGTFVQQVRVRNIGASPLSGPLAIVITGLAANVAVANASGTTACILPSGDPFVLLELDGGTLEVGRSVNVVLQFRTTDPRQIVYSARLFAGSNR